MKGVLLVTISIACLLVPSSGVLIKDLVKIFKDLPIAVWANLVFDKDGNPISNVGGRSGPISIDVGDQFFDKQCKEDKIWGKNGDVCFIVQTSCRKGKNAFPKLMRSISNDMKEILKALREETMFTTVTYAGETRVVAKWSQNSGRINPGKLKGGKHCDDCRARTDLAIDECLKQFDNDKITKRDVPKTIVFFTDGISFESKSQNISLARAATGQRLLDIQNSSPISLQVIKIHEDPVDPAVDPNLEWIAMNAVNTGDFDESVRVEGLGLFHKQHVKIPIVGGTSEDSMVEKECCTADVVFILDTSDSIEKEDVALLLHFIHGFIEVQQKIIEPNNPNKHSGLQISVITYCGTVTVRANLGEKGREELMNIIDAINRDTVNCKYTSTHLALDEAYNQLNGSNSRIEPHVRKIVCLATDGRTWKVGASGVYTGDDTINAAQRIKDDLKGELYVIGLPNYKKRPDVGEWEAISSPPKNCTLIDMRDGTFEDLNEVGKYFTKKICLQSSPEFCYFDYLANNPDA